MKKEFSRTEIEIRRAKLIDIAATLKKQFYGIDDVIDKIIKGIEVWYLMPELLTRPLIINLWGLTGTGKTDLVRKLVSLLGFSDRFCQIMMKEDTRNYITTVSELINGNPKMESGKPGVIFFDEIQALRTRDENGKEIDIRKYTDIWNLLSDGKLPITPDISEIIDYVYSKSKLEDKTLKKHKTADQDNYDYYQARSFKSNFRLSESIEEIMEWNQHQRLAVARRQLRNPQIYEEEDYSKFLIIIAGNLDKAYPFSGHTSLTDINADIIYEKSKTVNILKIKEVLLERFRPEEISRFGNIHIIYPSLNRLSYEKLIEHKLSKIVDSTKTLFGVTLHFDPSINRLLYDNGVYPTQGVRPLFSTITEIVENNIPVIVLDALMNEVHDIQISYKNEHIEAFIGDITKQIKYSGSIDILRKEKSCNTNRKTLIAVHEAGHSLIYALLFGIAPTQINVNTASNNLGGFIWTHENGGSRDQIEKKIKTLLAGAEAERLVFGQSHATSGCESDIDIATSLAAGMIRDWGMFHLASKTVVESESGSSKYNTNHMLTNNEIEELLSKAKENTALLLQEHSVVLNNLTKILIEKGQIDSDEFQALLAEHKIAVEIKEIQYEHFDDYNKLYNNFAAYCTNGRR